MNPCPYDRNNRVYWVSCWALAMPMPGADPPEVFVSERAPGPHRSGDHSTEPEEQALAGGLAEGDELGGRGDLLLAPYPDIAERRLLEPGHLALEP